MKNEIKKIFSYIGAFFLGVFSIICGYLFHNRRTDDRIGEQLNGIGELEQRKAERIERIAEGERTDAERIKRSKEILSEIKNSQRTD